MGIYKSEAGEAAIKNWYEKFLQKLPFEVTRLKVNTSIGETSVIVSGPENGTPVVCIHGALSGAPQMLSLLGDFPRHYRVYAIDVPGQSVASVQVRPDVKTDAFGKWLNEVTNELGLNKFVLLAVSWGGFIALNFARLFPEKIIGMVLITPAGIVNGLVFKAMKKIVWPMMIYNLFPSEKRRDWAFSSLMTTTDPMWSPFIAQGMKVTKTDFSVPPLVTKEQMKNVKAPVFVFAADKDLSFPGEPLIEQAKEIFPNLVGTHLFRDCYHVPPFTEEFTKDWVGRLKEVMEKKFGAVPVKKR